MSQYPSGLSEFLGCIRRHGMDIILQPSPATNEALLRLIFRFFQDHAREEMQHRHVFKGLCHRILNTAQLRHISRTKLRGVLTMLKNVRCIQTHQGPHAIPVIVSISEGLDTFDKFRGRYDYGLLAYASYHHLTLTRKDLATLTSSATSTMGGVYVDSVTL